jgi:ABC-type Fe3+ transport system permease subunit
MTSIPNRPIDKGLRYVRKIKNDYSKEPLKYLFTIPVVIFFLFFLVIPTSLVFVAAVRTEDGGFSLEIFRLILTDPKFIDWNGDENSKWISTETIPKPSGDETWLILSGKDYGVILNSMIIAFATTLLSLIIGTGLALFMAKREFRGKKLVSLLLLVPLIIPPFVGGVGFFTMVGQRGILNEHFLAPTFGVRIILEGLVALVFVEAFHYYTLVYLNVYSSLINIDPSLEEQAKNLGSEGFTLLRTVTLPLALPGIAAGTILTFILALEDLGTPIVFAAQGDTIARHTMTYYIFSNLELNNPNSINVVPADSAVIGTILLVFAIVAFYAIKKYVSMRAYAMSGKGRAGERSIPQATRKETIGFYFIYTIIFLLSIIIHVGLIIRAFSKGVDFPPKWTFENFEFIFDSANDVTPYIFNTVIFSLLALFVVIIFGTMAAYALERYDFKGKTIFDTIITIPIALPGVVIGLGYIVFFTNSRSFDPLGAIGRSSDFRFTLDPFVYPVILLICSYGVRKFPFAVRSIYAGIQQTTVDLEEASVNLGATKGFTIAAITLPLISLNIVAGSLVTLVYTLSEVSTTLIIVTDNDYGTITWYMGHLSAARLSVYAALGTLLMILQIVSLAISSVLLRNRAEAMTGI